MLVLLVLSFPHRQPREVSHALPLCMPPPCFKKAEQTKGKQESFFFFFFKNSLATLGPSCGTQNLRCIMRDPFAVAHRLSCGTWAPQHTGSVVRAHQPSCSAACGVLFLWPGVGATSPAVQGGPSTTGPPGRSPKRGELWCQPQLWLQPVTMSRVTSGKWTSPFEGLSFPRLLNEE